MVGITSYGAYVPWRRISRKIISNATGWLNPAGALPGEKAVANYDEDSLTMSVAAALNCLNGFGRDAVDGLYLATCSAPYAERQNATIAATALDLRSDIRTSDFTDSVRAGTGALLAACDTVKAGSSKCLLVCAADCRLGASSGLSEQALGDGAGALLVGDTNVIASLEGAYSVSYDFMDVWRTSDDTFVRSWEDRWIREEGYTKFIPEAISGLLNKYGLNIKDFAKVVYPCLYAREHAVIGKKLGAEPSQIQENMSAAAGNTGAAYPFMLLIAALEDAKPGDKILVASYGNGSDAMFFQVTEEIEKLGERRATKKYLSSKTDLMSYEKYMHFRRMMHVEKTGRADLPFTAISARWRERDWILSLVGSKCKRCGTPQYPSQRICVKPGCGAVDEMEPYCFSDKKARLFTYTGDNLAPCDDPPQVYGLVDFEVGGRSLFDMTDCVLEDVRVGMPVEMSFRKVYSDPERGIHNYWWKAAPPR